MVSDEAIVLGLIEGLGWLARHAVDRCAAGGNALLRARLVHQEGAKSIEIGHTRFYGFGETKSKVAHVGRIDPAEAVATLDDLVAPSHGLALAVTAVSNEIGQAFGIAEMGQFTVAGELRPNYFKAGQQMQQWAQQNAIPVAGEG